jgi:heat shock protein HslJ
MMKRGSVVARRLMMAFSAAVLAAAVLGAEACGGDETDPAALDGTNWKLAGWSVSSLAPADFTITADFEDARISGTSVVSSYGGPYETGPGDDFSIGPLSSTMGGGTEDEGRAERIYFDLLKAVESYAREGDALTLYDAEGNESLVFELVPGS